MALLSDRRATLEKEKAIALANASLKGPQCVTLGTQDLPGGASLAVVELLGKPLYNRLKKEVVQKKHRLVIVTSSTGHISVTMLR